MTCFSRIPSLVTSVLSVFTSSGENIWKVMLKQRNIIGPWGFGKLNWVSPFEKSISLESPKSWWIYIYILLMVYTRSKGWYLGLISFSWSLWRMDDWPIFKPIKWKLWYCWLQTWKNFSNCHSDLGSSPKATLKLTAFEISNSVAYKHRRHTYIFPFIIY